ncbi:hypothetical protein [Pseudonocardia sp. H11422]|uniref:hypothetical protein n=1 Tax=Pseudonocardia sp. H11422 TaxID=2835866 RepID=UPI001BDD8265|nr:hypothetical protein [Pseudonocardia sp. H11422]
MIEEANPAGYSAVLETIVRVSGAVPVRLDATHVGTPEQQVGLTLGSVLVYLRSQQTVRVIVEGWQSAAVAARHLGPARPISHHRAGLAPAAGSQVSTLVRLGGIPTVLAAPITRRPGSPVPSHVRIQVGPIVWQVCDWNAYEALAAGWRRAADLLRRGE